jgi:hypothetical protein
MMEDILKKKCPWHIPSMKDLKAILNQSKECQKELNDRVDKVKERIAMLDGEDKWMSRFDEYKEHR